ncbi:MAG: alpha/beta hydrolase [Vicinamibacteria bacterium]
MLRVSTLVMVAAVAAGPARAADAPLANGSFTVDLDGRKIHYEVHGQGPVLMTLTNSWGLTGEGLRGLYRPLEEKLTLVYFDPRGMGASGPASTDADRGMAAVREDFRALQKHLKIRKANVIGWSNGAMNLLLLATETPDALASAIFVHGIASFGREDMMSFGERFPDVTRRFTEFGKQMADPKLTDADRTALQKTMWMGEYFPFLLKNAKLTGPRLQEAFGTQPFSHPHTRQTDIETGGFDVRPKLGTIKVPALVIAGAADAAPPAKVKEIADGIPGAVFKNFEQSGHFAPIEEPEAFRQAVYDFLKVR